MVRCYCGEELGHFCWPVMALGVAVFSAFSSICWTYFSDIVVLLGFRKLSWIRPTADQQTVTPAIFWCKFSFVKCLGGSQFNQWADHHQLSYTIQFPSHIIVQPGNGSFLLHGIREDTLKLLFFSSLWSAHEAPT